MTTVRPQRRSAPPAGELLTLDVESLAYGGKGVARRNGYVVFVAGALPGDRVRAEVTRAKRGYAEASTTEVVRRRPPIGSRRAATTAASPAPAPPGRPSPTRSSSTRSSPR